MDIVYINKRRYEIQERKDVLVWYTGVYRSIWSTATNIISIVPHTWLEEVPCVPCRKEFKSSSDGGYCNSKKCKRGYGGVWSPEPGGRFCVGAFGRNLALVAVKALAWRDWGKSRTMSVRISGLWAEISTRDLPNTKQEC
jgi:hypothetical protein